MEGDAEDMREETEDGWRSNTDEQGYDGDDQWREMHLTAEDHAGDPSTRYDLMDLLGTGNFGKVYKA